MSVRSLAASSWVALLTVLAGCVSPPLSQEGTNAALMTRLLEDMDGGSFALFDELCAPRHRLHAPGRSEPLGCATQKRSLRALQRAFSDLDQRVDDVFGAGDKVRCRGEVPRPGHRPFRQRPDDRDVAGSRLADVVRSDRHYPTGLAPALARSAGSTTPIGRTDIRQALIMWAQAVRVRSARVVG